MPLLYSYKNAETDPDKLWKIKRRVAKSLRMANEDDRGLAETSDMSDEVESITDKLKQIEEKTINVVNYFLNELPKLQRSSEIMTIPEFSFSLLEKFLTEFNKLDINKMNSMSVQTIQSYANNLENYVGELEVNIADFREKVGTMTFTRRGRPPKKSPAKGGVEEMKGDEEEEEEKVPSTRKGQLDNLLNFYDKIIKALQELVNKVKLKLLNYRQTTAVLREEGISNVPDMFGSGMRGGCCCDARLEYYPQYQNKMFY